MGGSRQVARGRAWPWGLLGMAALVATFEPFVAGRDRFATDRAGNWRCKARAATREAAGAEILGFGDSMVEFGLVPRVIEARLGRRAYNLALHAGPPAASYFLLRRVLEAGGRPAAVVVDFMPHQLAMSPRHADFRRAWPELAGPRDGLDLARSTRDAPLLASLLLSRALPSLGARHEIRACLMAALRGEALSAKEVLRLLRRNWDRNRGAQVMPERPRDREEVGRPNHGLFPDSWSCDPDSVGYVRRFLALAAARGIRVVWLLPPISPEAQARRERLGLDASYTRFVRAIRAEFPAVVVDGRRAGYGPELFVDTVHLNRRGALALSDDLATLLARLPAGPGWVDLPAYRDRPIGPLAEDLDQSRVALGIGRPGRPG